MKKWIKVLLVFFHLLINSLVTYSFFQFKDRHKGYFLDLLYREINSLGPETGSVIHKNIIQILKEIEKSSINPK